MNCHHKTTLTCRSLQRFVLLTTPRRLQRLTQLLHFACCSDSYNY